MIAIIVSFTFVLDHIAALKISSAFSNTVPTINIVYCHGDYGSVLFKEQAMTQTVILQSLGSKQG